MVRWVLGTVLAVPLGSGKRPKVGDSPAPPTWKENHHCVIGTLRDAVRRHVGSDGGYRMTAVALFSVGVTPPRQ